MSSSTQTPPPSPLQSRFHSHSPSSKVLRFPDVANLLVKMGRSQKRAKANNIQSSSGDEPRTHPSLAPEGVVSARKVPVVEEERFNCRDGVDVVKLLRAIRATLYEKAESIGANVLVDEQWVCTIYGPKHRNGAFRVYIRYSANAARSDRPDPQRPVALENVRSVPGLMTVLSRDE
ncbi:hypothetical protein C8Q75DRAFT_598991 [Abortiporus biennis]|nr:hypothetical protein C8Q75DRAFT_598991 [Abortiporus biennis]